MKRKYYIYLFFINLLCKADFDKLMDYQSYFYRSKYCSNSYNYLNLCFLKNLYNKHNNYFYNKNTKIKIPKIIHQIWIGDKPIPLFYKKLQKSWKKFHKDWQYMLWTDKDVKNFNLINQKMYFSVKSLTEKSDLLRYEILYKFGGLYVDMDFECISSFDKLNYLYDFYVGISSNNTNELVNNALIACTINHPIIKTIIANVKNNVLINSKHRSGVFYFSKQFCKLVKTESGINVAMPISFFYSIPYKFNSYFSIKPYIKDETMALHYWGSYSGTNLNIIKT